MRRSWVRGRPAVAIAAAIVAIAGIVGPVKAGGRAAPPASVSALDRMTAHSLVRSETIVFGANSERVQLLRGTDGRKAVPPPVAQIVSFGAQQVRIVRGGATAALSPPGRSPAPDMRQQAATRIQQVSFGDAIVTVVRGLAASVPPALDKPADDNHLADLFGPANGDELDRIAFAVEGVESSHGANLAMWRPQPAGPQGPMQISAAAALDVGGGDRFDVTQNRVLGRAYLARMFRRYGNWPDALKAYNWGPGNLDQWIAGGRDPARLPFGVGHYASRVLRDALMHTAMHDAAVGL
jgi:hypothetical protein